MSILRVEEVSKRFGGLQAINDVSLEIRTNEILGLIGPNGSGKTTLFNLICGFLSPTSGKLIFKGQEIQGLPPHRIAELGITRTFQLTEIFSDLTLLENLYIGSHLKIQYGFWDVFFNRRKKNREEQKIMADAQDILRFLKMERKGVEKVNQMSYGEKRMVELAIALAFGPQLLLLDEPAAGLSPEETQELMERVGEIRAQGVTIFLVEHHMKMVMGLCDRIVVINSGQIIAEGTPSEISRNEEVIRLYLGEETNYAEARRS